VSRAISGTTRLRCWPRRDILPWHPTSEATHEAGDDRWRDLHRGGGVSPLLPILQLAATAGVAIASKGPNPHHALMPEASRTSIPIEVLAGLVDRVTTVVGAVAFRNEALNWTPCVRSLIQDPLAWTNSPAEIIAA
jgi:hypothetical protein